MQLCIWRHFGFELPDDWELLQFTRNPEKGRCAFADRYRYRFEINWTRVDGPPDVDRMLSDYLTKLTDEGLEGGRRCAAVGWTGLVGTQDDQVVARFGLHVPEEDCMVEVVFIWPDKRDKKLESDVLRRFRHVPAHSDGSRRWCAFGMDLRAPEGVALESCTVQAAMSQMEFVDPRERLVARFCRRGLVEDWQRGSIDTWLARWVADDMVVTSRTSSEQGQGHTVHSVQGRRKVKGLLRKGPLCRAEAWLCPTDKRLYSWLANASDPNGDPPLMCCGEVSHGNG